MLTFDAARALLLSKAPALSAERVPLDDADGRVLAEDLVAPFDLPAFDYSAMDGYAVRAEDFVGAGPFTLPVRGESAAGGPLATFEPGSALRIFTGAPVPPPADAVVMQENVRRDGDRAHFDSAPRPGEHVRRRGEDLAAGSVALAKGTRLGPGAVALAAALDRPTLRVARRPVVTVLCTGDELRSPGDRARPGSVVESNGYFVAAAARRAGAIARVAPFVPDDPDRAAQAIEAALRGADVVVTIGGVSVGDHDVVRPALERAGVTIEFHKVALKPGKPLTFGCRDSLLVLGLPGNPASASLTFLLFGAPLLRTMQGDAAPSPLPERLPVRGTLRRKAGRMELVRATIAREGGERVAVLAPNRCRPRRRARSPRRARRADPSRCRPP
jgi:molybdopterin molybdotransferase